MTRLTLLTVFLALTLTACNLPIALSEVEGTQPTEIASTPTEGLVTVSTEIPTPLPDTPLGTDANPIVLSLLPSSGREIPESARDVAAQLSHLTGLVIVPFAPASQSEVVDALGAGRVHIAWLAPIPYLLAHEKGYADAALATTVFGRDLSAAQFLVNRRMVDDRLFTTYYDPLTGANLADAESALQQFKDKKPCWTDPYSATGYIVPLGVLNENGIETKVGAFVQGHATVIKSLYADPEGNICQFGVTIADNQVFIASGYEDAAERVAVVWETEAIVPFDGVAYASSLPDGMRISLSAAFLSMLQTEQGSAILRDTYQIDGLKFVDDTFYDALRHMLEQSGLNLSGLVR
jgi:phosphonate transport system substrate-binding protein